MIITTSEIQNNFGKYLKLSALEEIVITKNGKKIAKLGPYNDAENLGHGSVREGSTAYKETGVRILYDEYLRIIEESENRFEYIDGELFLLASPLYAHQKVVGLIFVAFLTWFQGHNCEPLVSPFDVTLYRNAKKEQINVVQPDIVVLCDHDRIDEHGKYFGIPALIVEVLSESTKTKDFTKKLNLYMESGVKEYWIVNTASAEIYIYVFTDRNIGSIHTFKKDDRALSSLFPGLGVELKAIYA